MLIHREALVAYIKGCKIMQHAHISSSMVDVRRGHIASDTSPFVCHIYPFIQTWMSAIPHSVCQYNPFVGLRAIRGFTLIEIMIALLVLAILASISIPSIQPIIRKNRLTTETNRLLSDLAYARAEGIMRSGNVTLCNSSDGAACIGENWSQGRLIFADLNGDGAPTPAGGEVLRYSEAPHTETTITGSGITYPLVFQARGMPAGVGAGTGLLITVYGLPSSEFRDVCINATGQTRVRRLSTDTPC